VRSKEKASALGGPAVLAAVPDPFADYREIERRIAAARATKEKAWREELTARWEFGRLVAAEAEANGGRLPHGRLDEIADALEMSRTEVGNRRRFAERYPTDADLANALASFESWRQVLCSLGPPPDEGSASRREGFPHVRFDSLDAGAKWADAGMPPFEREAAKPKLIVNCDTDADRDAAAALLGTPIAKRSGGTVSVCYPPRAKEDPCSLRYEPA
jgi:hypothetical protein